MADFGKLIKQWATEASQSLEDVDRGFKFALFDQVVRNTRVDTGRMRGNWQVSTGQPAAGETGDLRKSGGLSSGEAAKIQPFSATWLTNNVPYVEVWELEDGMVGLAIANAEATLNRLLNAQG